MSDNPDLEDLTVLLQAAVKGDSDAQNGAVMRVYEELHGIAQQIMRHEPNQTLQPTVLVNEAFLRLFGNAELDQTPDRAYFFAAAAQAMRRILVEAARRRKTQKRGGDRSREMFNDQFGGMEFDSDGILDLNQALIELEQIHPRQAQIVQMRWFAQYTVAQVAQCLGISDSTVEQDWRVARAFLKSRLGS